MEKYKKWLNRIFIGLLLIIIIPPWAIIIALFLSSYPFSYICERTVENINIVCNQCYWEEFAECIYKNFPVGSSAENLDRYLRGLDFSRFDKENGRIVYQWERNWRVTFVSVNLNEHGDTIIEIKVNAYSTAL